MPVNTLSRKREEKEKCAKRAGGEKKCEARRARTRNRRGEASENGADAGAEQTRRAREQEKKSSNARHCGRGERKRNFTAIAAQNFGVRYARLIPCVKTLTQKASGKARTGAGDASAARKKPLRFFAEAFRRFVVYVFLGVPQSQTRILLTYVKAATPFLCRAIRGKKRFLPARTRRAYNDYPAPVR